MKFDNFVKNNVIMDHFKAAFKKYKRRDVSLDLSQVIDVRDGITPDCVTEFTVQLADMDIEHSLLKGLQPIKDWKMYKFNQHEGFYLISNPFSFGYQQYWAARCLQDLPFPPNRTNLDMHMDIDPRTLWSNYAKTFDSKYYNTSCSLHKLRWTTVGYQYNWQNKEYKEQSVSPFPEDFVLLSEYICHVLGFKSFTAQSGIINYYHHDSSLGGHTDHSELDHDAPLISISFGQDAIFLLGGQTKAVEPNAIMLHSGDVCIMSGPSRLAYHAVPCILPHDNCLLVDELCTVDFCKSCCIGTGNSVEREVCSLVDKSDSTQHVRHLSGRDCGHCVQCHPRNQEDEDVIVYNSCEIANNPGPLFSCCNDGTKLHMYCADFSGLVFEDMIKSDLGLNIIDHINNGIEHKMCQLRKEWYLFAAYFAYSRVNINIRQVLKPGQTFQSCDHKYGL